jgi:hypothetical protein
VPAWNCSCARTGQLTAARATPLIPTALGSPPVRRTANASQIADLLSAAVARLKAGGPREYFS